MYASTFFKKNIPDDKMNQSKVRMIVPLDPRPIGGFYWNILVRNLFLFFPPQLECGSGLLMVATIKCGGKAGALNFAACPCQFKVFLPCCLFAVLPYTGLALSFLFAFQFKVRLVQHPVGVSATFYAAYTEQVKAEGTDQVLASAVGKLVVLFPPHIKAFLYALSLPQEAPRSFVPFDGQGGACFVGKQVRPFRMAPALQAIRKVFLCLGHFLW
jgi:hypothetical protein